jgi:hypothetical protein
MHSTSCTPVVLFAANLTLKVASHVAGLNCFAAIATISLDVPLGADSLNRANPAELNTGPPTGSLVVSLHRFLI